MANNSGGGGNDVEAGFAKLQGEDFEYYMQTYSIVLGRNSKKSTVDVDLSSLGGGMNISRHHARIFYDFQRRRFALEVLGKNGCSVEGVLHLPGNPPVKLDSQDLLQIGDKEFYFLLPVRSILGGPPPRSLNTANSHHHQLPLPHPHHINNNYNNNISMTSAGAMPMIGGKKSSRAFEDDEYGEDDDDYEDGEAPAAPASGSGGKAVALAGQFGGYFLFYSFLLIFYTY